MSTYNASIPQASDLISNSQAQILGNFSQLNTQFAIDHVAFNTGSGNGDGTHKKITFDNAPTEPVPTGTISNIFPLLVGSNQELFFKNASTEYNGTAKIQLTGPFLASANGYITLPGPILVKWGSFSASSGVATFSYPTGATIPVFSHIYQVFLQPTNAPGSPDYFAYIVSKSTTGFSYDSVKRTTNTGATGTYSYLSIGN